MEQKVEQGFKEQDAKIDKVYEDGIDAFNEYREFNNEQMKLIIDYSEENKELLKKMLELNSQEKANEIESDLEKSKREISQTELPEKLEIVAQPKVTPKISIGVFTEVATGISHYHVSNAPPNYLDTLDLTKYEIREKSESLKYEGLYDFIYVDKK